MTRCSFNRLLETEHGDEPQTEQREAALRNDRAYFDDWTASRPATQWPAASITFEERGQVARQTIAVSLVSTLDAARGEGSRGRGELVQMRSLPGDILETADTSQPVGSATPAEPAD